jgi:molybdate transport system ATP-binding protein
VLRCLAGLETPELGHVTFGDGVWFDTARRINLSPQSRAIGFLFQEYALFPHLTVFENIAFGLPRVDKGETDRRVGELVAMLQLGGLEGRFPHQLSGGQQQRVALARTVAPRPRLLLLDEPLSALDAPTRTELRSELRCVLSQWAIPTIVVTHDAVEVRSLADEAVVMCDGQVRQHGPIDEVFSRPVDPDVARIVGA